MQVFIGNPLEEESATAQKYIDEVIKRLLCLKKLDGYPVIRELDNDEDEEVSSLLDMNEIEKLAKYVLCIYCTMTYMTLIFCCWRLFGLRLNSLQSA